MGDGDVWDILEGAGDEAADQDSGSTDSLRSFLWQVEAALLAVEPQASVLEAPSDLPPEIQAECRDLLTLLAPARAGDVPALLEACTWLQPLAAGCWPPLPKEGEEAQAARARVEAAGAAFQAAAQSPGSQSVRGAVLLVLGAAALQRYARLNWTGPPLPEEGGDLPCKELLEELQVDGEPVYELVCGVGSLWLAAVLLGALPGGSSPPAPLALGWSAAVWRGRCAFAWQLSLADASERGVGQSPRCFKLSICDLARAPEGSTLLAQLLPGEALSAVQETVLPVLQTWHSTRGKLSSGEGAKDSAAPVVEESDDDAAALRQALSYTTAAVRATLLVELAARLCWYGRVKPWEAVSKAAGDLIGFSYEITGVMGIKRQYQTEEFSQMAVKARTAASSAKASGAGEADGAAPENMKLSAIDDLTDILEVPKLSSAIDRGERDLLEQPLAAVEQLVLLAKCNELWVTSNPNDELLLQSVNALAQRVLRAEDAPCNEGGEDGTLFTANWLIFSCGLYYRCRAEHHRNKTRERASFQLQALVDQFEDAKPSATHRLLLVHSAGYPARFHLQHEMGTRMMRMGMVSTAHEQFKKLRMWPEAVDCLMIAERNAEALDMVRDLLTHSPSPRLWCCLGDLEKEPGHYEKAWELSKGHFARAQRSLGRHYFRKDDMEKAVQCFSLALEINPLHSDIWFTMGCGQMRLERYADAAVTFSRCISINDEHGEAWANLAATHSAQGKLQEARNCMVEATRRCRENWKMWESFLGICLQLRDIQGCIQGMKRLVELDQERRLQEQILGMLTACVISDKGGLYDHRTGRAFAGQLDEFFKFLTSTQASEPCYWQFWAELQEAALGQDEKSLESRLKQIRASKAILFEVRDPEAFSLKLQDLQDCLEVVADRLLQGPAADPRRQALAYSVSDVSQQLQARLESAVQQPAWLPAHEAIKALSARLEAAA